MNKYNLNDLPSAIDGRYVTFPVNSFDATKLLGSDVLVEGQDEDSNALYEKCQVLDASSNCISFEVTQDFYAGNFMKIELYLPEND